MGKKTNFFFTCICLAVLVVLCGCGKHWEAPDRSEEPQEYTEPEMESIETTPPKRLDFGGGYKEAKWNMSKEDVKRVLPGEVIAEEDDFMHLYLGGGERRENAYGGEKIKGGKRINCWFYRNRLYGVDFDPGLDSSDEQGVTAIFNALKKNYGSPEVLKNKADGFGFPLIAYRWSDGETEIMFRVRGEEDWSYYMPCSVRVKYVSISIQREIDLAKQREAEETQRKEEQRIRERERNYSNEL